MSRRQAVSLVIILIIATASLAGCRRASQPAATPAQPKAPQEQQHKAENNAAPVEPKASESSTAAPKAEPVVTETGTQLYARHCSACHGERGDGKGVAAVFLFPKPRDFRAGKFRLVSTSNNVPTREDLQAVLLRGMPGSSMPAWAHLSQPERDRLVDEVMRLRVDGVRETVVGRLKEEEGMTDQEIADSTDAQKMIEDEIKSATTPGEGRAVPTIGQPTEASIARGKENYAKFVCISCHGASGRGDGVQEMFDDEKLPARPRDFTLGIFKGNTDPSSIYRRIAFGMPGTPMPASSTMTSEQMVDLVHYILSLSTEKQRQAVVPKREKLVVNRVTEIPSSSADNEWAKISPIHLQLTPLWWRTDTDPNFQVQAAHDGKTLAIRMTWLDSTPNLDSLHSASFKDAIALELYRGSAEPFLGMGSPESVVDVWFWDADRQNKLASVDQANPNAIVDYFPFNEASVSSAELSRPTGLMAGQPAISLPARSVGNQIVPPANDSGGSSLQAAGPRTLTFRMPANQIVKAHGEWADGRWTVVMKRPLAAASPDDGISLEPGASSSIAFAAWDGSHQDRNGQKFVTFWQDLEIEK